MVRFACKVIEYDKLIHQLSTNHVFCAIKLAMYFCSTYVFTSIRLVLTLERPYITDYY